ncbi:MAG: DUF3341 domain-containing protein [Chitinophagales bacterium]|nr:DUF3341 domain-containing protein [Chitinophagales bacterium]
MSTKKYLVGLFDDDHTLLHAIENAVEQNMEMSDVYTPFPVHGIEDKMKMRRTKLHTAGFIFGLTGTITAFSLMAFANAVNYPINFGGKPVFALPAWIPIMFEFTVLFSGVGMVLTFYYLNNLYPGKKPEIIDPRLTDDMFAITFDMTKDSSNKSNLSEFLKKEGAVEVFEKEF